MFDLIRNFLEHVLQFVPRISRRPSRLQFLVVDGVRGIYVSKRPQLYIEFLTHVEFYPRTPQPLDLELQTLTTGDGTQITLNATISACIIDPVTLRVTLGQEEWLFNTSIIVRQKLAKLVAECSKYELKEMIADGRLESLIAKEVAGASHYSLKITRFAVEDMAETQARRHYGLNSQNVVLG